MRCIMMHAGEWTNPRHHSHGLHRDHHGHPDGPRRNHRRHRHHHHQLGSQPRQSLSAQHAPTVMQYYSDKQPDHPLFQAAPTIMQCSQGTPASRSFGVACTCCHAELSRTTRVDNQFLQHAPTIITLCSQSRSSSTCAAHPAAGHTHVDRPACLAE